MEAKIIKTDGTELVSTPNNGVHYTLEESQAIVGGFIEYLYLDADTVMVVNEEGLNMGLPFNLGATTIAREKLKTNNIFLVGEILMCSRKMLR